MPMPAAPAMAVGADGGPAWPTLARRQLHRQIGAAWTWQNLQVCLAAAFGCGWVGYFLGWAIGGSGRLGDLALLADPAQPARLVGGIGAILLPWLALRLGRWLGRLERTSGLWLARRLRRRLPHLQPASVEHRLRQLSALLLTVSLLLLLYRRRPDLVALVIPFAWLTIGPVAGVALAGRVRRPWLKAGLAVLGGAAAMAGAAALLLACAAAGAATIGFLLLGAFDLAMLGGFGALASLLIGGLSAGALAMAGAGAATLALSLVGAGAGIATVTGMASLARAGAATAILALTGAYLASLLWQDAIVAAAAAGWVTGLAIAAAVGGRGHAAQAAYGGALGAGLVPAAAAIWLGYGQQPLIVFGSVFWLLLPSCAGLLGWLAFGLADRLRRAIALRTARRRVWPGALIGLASALLVGLALGAIAVTVLAGSLASYNLLVLRQSGQPAFQLAPTLTALLGNNWREVLWLSGTWLLPLAPVLLEASLLAGWPLANWLAIGQRSAGRTSAWCRFAGSAVCLPIAWLIGWLLAPGPLLATAARLGIAWAEALWR